MTGPTAQDRRAVVVDLDGTLASVQWRLHHVSQPRRDWQAFFAGMDADTPVPWVVELLRADHGDTAKVILSGRPETYREVCRGWLDRHGIPYDELILRSTGDFRPDHVVKAEIYERTIAPHYSVAVVVDDRPSVVAMWRARGLYVIQPTDPALSPSTAPVPP
ncbi:MAG: hypothetical protein M3252_08360 [Actinomycetota bacterium]|nr:hypothetical protein [Actinomycetota bacterium]